MDVNFSKHTEKLAPIRGPFSLSGPGTKLRKFNHDPIIDFASKVREVREVREVRGSSYFPLVVRGLYYFTTAT
jgi:hypothetical protein